MAACPICTEEIPKPRRCAHGKKPANCTSACQAAYVVEHEAACQARQDTNQNLEATSGDQDAAGANADLAGGGAEVDTNAAEPDVHTAEPDVHAAEPNLNNAEAGGVSDFDYDLVKQVRNCQMVTCRNCYRTYEKLGIEKILKCGRCLLVGYCGRECQRVHWENQHKRECRLMKELAEAAMSNENVEAASG